MIKNIKGDAYSVEITYASDVASSHIAVTHSNASIAFYYQILI